MGPHRGGGVVQPRYARGGRQRRAGGRRPGQLRRLVGVRHQRCGWCTGSRRRWRHRRRGRGRQRVPVGVPAGDRWGPARAAVGDDAVVPQATRVPPSCRPSRSVPPRPRCVAPSTRWPTTYSSWPTRSICPTRPRRRGPHSARARAVHRDAEAVRGGRYRARARSRQRPGGQGGLAHGRGPGAQRWPAGSGRARARGAVPRARGRGRAGRCPGVGGRRAGWGRGSPCRADEVAGGGWVAAKA